MIQHLRSIRLAFVLCVAFSAVCLAEPKPSPYPITWEFKFTHGPIRRVMVKAPGETAARPYWYMTYQVTNNTDQERSFLPVFEMMTKDGKTIRSDLNISAAVFDVIKQREKIKFLEGYPAIADQLRLGEDQARDGVAIWREPMAEMGQFSVFVGSLSGEVQVFKDAKDQPVKDAQGNPVLLRKTLQIKYLIRGDEVYPGEDPVVEQGKEWVMR